MNRLLWLLPPALLLAGAVGGVIMGRAEAPTYAQSMLINNWDRLSPETHESIRAAMTDGKLSQWEWVDIKDAAYSSKGLILGGDYQPDPDKIRTALQQLVSALPSH